MIATPPHNRKLGLLGVALTKARNPREDVKALSIIRDEIEAILIASNFYDATPFSWITLSIRFGLKNEKLPSIGRVSKKYGDLALAIEIDTLTILDTNLNQLCSVFRQATLKSLIYVGNKYSCPIKELKYATINSTPIQ